MDDASSVFDASILTGPVANYPGRRQLQSHARARLLDGRHSARVRVVGGLGHPVRRESAQPGRRRRRRARERLDADGRSYAAVGHADRRHADDQQQRVRRIRHAAAEPGGRSDASRRRAIGQPLVQHQRVRDRAAVHDRHELAQSGSRPGLSQSRSGADAARAAPGEQGAGGPRRDLQRDEHAAARGAQRRVRLRGVWDDHVCRRSRVIQFAWNTSF